MDMTAHYIRLDLSEAAPGLSTFGERMAGVITQVAVPG
jgi:hypothetical protein